MSNSSSHPPKSQKGTFGRPAGITTERVPLPLSKRYIVPSRRRAMLAAGLGAGLVVALVAWLDVRFGGGTALSGGPLTSAHATLESDCAACHGGESRRIGESVADAACASCHEPKPVTDEDPASPIFAYAVHAESRTREGTPRVFDRVPSCADCHREHDGRDASLVAMSDARCQSCHENSDFDGGHPDFAFTEAPEGDDDALQFAHGQHVKEILKRTAWDAPERTCLRCHQPTADGRGFQAIEYDRHCADCHLGPGVATGRLALADASAPSDVPGVWSLARIRRSGLPGTDWAFYLDPGAFRGAGNRVAKLRLEHADPWILFNLRRLRRQRYGDAGVADLLPTAPAADSDETTQYRQAIDALEAQAETLRGSQDPAVQAELTWIEEQLSRTRARVGEPGVGLTGLTLPAGTGRLPQDRVDAWEDLVTSLAEPCSSCHRIDRATVVGIESDQRVLRQAEFDHAPHLLERGCLQCHDALPIREALETEDLDSLDDRAAIHNLPPIATCRECHGAAKVASSCVDCHTFHPDSLGRRVHQLASLGAGELRDAELPDRQEPAP